MSIRSRVNRFAEYVEGLRACAGAVEAGRKPNARALAQIGLAADTFENVKLR